MATLTYDEARRRVDVGAAWLDEFMPGWAERVDTVRLNMNSTCNCVLGQLVASEGERGGYDAAVSVNGLNWLESRQVARYGFIVSGEVPIMIEAAAYKLLDFAWITAIAERVKD